MHGILGPDRGRVQRAPGPRSEALAPGGEVEGARRDESPLALRVNLGGIQLVDTRLRMLRLHGPAEISGADDEGRLHAVAGRVEEIGLVGGQHAGFLGTQPEGLDRLPVIVRMEPVRARRARSRRPRPTAVPRGARDPVAEVAVRQRRDGREFLELEGTGDGVGPWVEAVPRRDQRVDLGTRGLTRSLSRGTGSSSLPCRLA
jgi:hypothetical protein